jgi:prepilin-type N-terminal cleavage/methylation domain-containing protein
MVLRQSSTSQTHVRRALDDTASRGFTLAEVVIAIAVLAIVVQGVIYGYIAATRRAEWSAHSLAAQSLASQGVEQARAAKWDPQAWPVVDELPPTNFVQADILDIPVMHSPIYATNYISIRTASANPPLREIRADCVWGFFTGKTFTNTVVTLRAPDQ